MRWWRFDRFVGRVDALICRLQNDPETDGGRNGQSDDDPARTLQGDETLDHGIVTVQVTVLSERPIAPEPQYWR